MVSAAGRDFRGRYLLGFLTFLARNARPLAFGTLHAFYSAPGQTFFIGLFVASFAAAFGLTPVSIGALYLAATLGSAATLLFVGHWIDQVRLVHYSAAVIVGLAAACILAAVAVGPLTLLLALYLLRLTGQGLMVHVESTATARAFNADRGKALGVTALGLPLAELVVPATAVFLISVIGWRWTYAAVGIVALVVLLPLTQWLLSGIHRGPRPTPGPNGAWRRLADGLALMMRSRYVWATLAALSLLPFGGTALYFHISTIVAAKGWPIAMIALSFPVSAIANVTGLFVAGRLIDRISARKVFLFHAVPHLIGIAILATATDAWALPVAFALAGFSFGLGKPTMTAMWAEVFGTGSLGTIRSAVAMFGVFASALAPFALGAALDGGVSVRTALLAYVALGIVAIIPPFIAERRGWR